LPYRPGVIAARLPCVVGQVRPKKIGRNFGFFGRNSDKGEIRTFGLNRFPTSPVFGRSPFGRSFGLFSDRTRCKLNAGLVCVQGNLPLFGQLLTLLVPKAQTAGLRLPVTGLVRAKGSPQGPSR
jgi:hypothetical protein